MFTEDMIVAASQIVSMAWLCRKDLYLFWKGGKQILYGKARMPQSEWGLRLSYSRNARRIQNFLGR